MKRRILCVIMALSLWLCPAASFAGTYDTVGDAEDFKTFEVDGLTYYDIYNGKTEGRDTKTEAIIDAALYGKKDGQEHSAAEYWTAFAAGVFAANKDCCWLAGKSFQYRFTNDVDGKNGPYGNMVKWLPSKSSKAMYTGDDFSRKNDINTRFSGKQTAKNLNQALDAACSSLADLNDGRLKASTFKGNHDLRALSEDTGDGTVVYNMMTTIDKDGGTARRTYNCFVVAYSNFAITPISGEAGEGITTALDEGGYQNLDEAIDAVNGGTEIGGFSVSESDETTKANLTNTGTGVASQTVSTEWSKEETLSSTISHEKELNFTQEESASFSFGEDTAFFKASAGVTFTEGELYRDGVSETNETTVSESGGASQTIDIPGHTSVEQYTTTTTFRDTMNYDCPVELSYTVTMFALCGEYYDDNIGTSYMSTAGYDQWSFMTQYGSSSNSSLQNLKDRIDHTGDTGYDIANGLTRGTRVWHAHAGNPWDSPWVNHIEYDKVQSAMSSEGISPGYDETTSFLMNNRPISINGAELARNGKAVIGFVGEVLPIHPLKTVDLVEPTDAEQRLAVGESLYLSNIKTTGINSKNFDFYGYSAKNGVWKLVDDDGTVLEESEVISLTKNKNGQYIVKGLAKGTASVQYFVNEKAYQLSDGSYVDPKDVATPVVEVTVSGTAANKAAGNKTAQADADTDADNALADEPETDISQEDADRVLQFLECDDQHCSVAEAALFVKNHIGAASSLNEQIYTKALLQMASDKISSNDTHAQMEVDAMVWAHQEGLFAHMQEEVLAAHGGITELEFAQMAYNAAVKYGEDVSCDDVIGQYVGADSLDEYERAALNWAISKGILSEAEETGKTLDPDRLMTTAEISDFL